MFYSPKTSTDGLVFHYDTGNTVRSYLGKPTTNFIANLGDPTEERARGEFGQYFNLVPIFETYGLVPYTLSMEIKGNIPGYCLVYMQNGSYTKYGFVSAAVEITTEWQRFVFPNITPSGPTAAWQANTPGDNRAMLATYTIYGSGRNPTIRNVQLELGSYATPFTPSARSATQGLKDLTGKNNIDIGSVSFNSNAQMTFDGTDDFIPLGNLGTIGSAYAIECVFNSTSVSSYRNVFDMNYNTYSGVTGNTGPRLEQTTGQGINFIWSGVANNNNLYNSTNIISISANRNYHVVFVQDGSTGKMYLDGTLRDSANNSQGYLQTFGDAAIGRGFTLDPSRYFSGGVYVFKIYKKALTADEVQRNFNAVKSRFNIA